MANFKITKLESIGKFIIPIFDKYPLLTTKQFNYERFKKAYYIMTDKSLSSIEKNIKLNDLKILKADSTYISPIFVNLEFDITNVENIEKNIKNISKILTKP